jgi:hypothetical protein
MVVRVARSSFALKPSAPFHFDATFHKPSNFPAPLTAWEPDKSDPFGSLALADGGARGE